MVHLTKGGGGSLAGWGLGTRLGGPSYRLAKGGGGSLAGWGLGGAWEQG